MPNHTNAVGVASGENLVAPVVEGFIYGTAAYTKPALYTIICMEFIVSLSLMIYKKVGDNGTSKQIGTPSGQMISWSCHFIAYYLNNSDDHTLLLALHFSLIFFETFLPRAPALTLWCCFCTSRVSPSWCEGTRGASRARCGSRQWRPQTASPSCSWRPVCTLHRDEFRYNDMTSAVTMTLTIY